MKAEDKARELIDKFRKYVDAEITAETHFVYSHDQETDMAKKCAIIAVDEILGAMGSDEFKVWDEEISYQESMNFVFWNEVKEEIINFY